MVDIKNVLEMYQNDTNRFRATATTAQKSRTHIERLLTRAAALASFGDVATIGTSVSSYEDPPVSVLFHLRSESRATTFVRDLVRMLGTKATKRPNYSAETLVVEMLSNGVKVMVYGYLPTTCKLITETVTEPVKGASIAEDGTIVHTVTRTRLECGGDDE